MEMSKAFSAARTGNTAKGLNRDAVEHKLSVTLYGRLSVLQLHIYTVSRLSASDDATMFTDIK